MPRSSPARQAYKAKRAARRAEDPQVQARAAKHERKRRQEAAKLAQEKAKAALAKMTPSSGQAQDA